MTLSEFKAWFEGYTEGLDGAPTEKQFKRIKAKVAEITGEPITRQVWLDHYRHYYRQYWSYPVWSGPTGGIGAVPHNGLGTASLMGMQANIASGAKSGGEGTVRSNDAEKLIKFDSHAAMYALGKSDAQAA